MKPAEQHKLFWAIYPPRISNGKKTKIGKYPCQLWFEAKKPDDKTFTEMCDWVKMFKANYEYSLKKNKFHAPPKDPIRFLKDRGWEDEIEPMTGATKKVQMCCECGGNATTVVGKKRYCPEHNPYKAPKFQNAEQRHNRSSVAPVKPEEMAEMPRDTDDTTQGAGSVSAPITTILGTEISSEAQAILDKFRRD